MPAFEILEEAVQLALQPGAPTAPHPLPPLPDAARHALDQGERRTRPGTVLAARRVVADRALTKQLRDWFIHAEVALGASPAERDRTLVEACRDAANTLIVAFATGRDLPSKR